jgi:hypothetical protein
VVVGTARAAPAPGTDDRYIVLRGFDGRQRLVELLLLFIGLCRKSICLDRSLEVVGFIFPGMLNPGASAFPAACCGISERLEYNITLRIEDSLQLTAGSFNVHHRHRLIAINLLFESVGARHVRCASGPCQGNE